MWLGSRRRPCLGAGAPAQLHHDSTVTRVRRVPVLRPHGPIPMDLHVPPQSGSPGGKKQRVPEVRPDPWFQVPANSTRQSCPDESCRRPGGAVAQAG